MNRNMARGLVCFGLAATVLWGCGLVIPFVPERITNLFLDEGAGAVGRNMFDPIQIDPRSEDSAGPHFAVAGDIDGDGLIDVATAWNQSKPLQIHFQRRIDGEVVFESMTLAGDFPITIVSGLAVEDMDGDGHADIVVLIKDTGVFARCRSNGGVLDEEDAPAGLIIIYFGPDDASDVTSPFAWKDVELSQSDTAGAAPSDPTKPEEGGYTSMTLADIDGQNGQDIIVAWNANDCEGGGNRVEFYTNPGPDTARQSNAWAPFMVDFDAPAVNSVAAFDVDRDGDQDIVATYPNARGSGIRWLRNPRIDIPDAFHLSDGTWQRGSIGEVSTGSDILVPGDIDQDGITDVVVRSTAGKVILWFKGPDNPTTDPLRNIPWQVYTIAEFKDRTPEALALGDIDADGQLEVIVSAQGAILWFNVFEGSTVFDQWQENMLLDDNPPDLHRPAVTDPNVDRNEISEDSTFINTVGVVDLDGDGLPDIISTLDRRGLSGVTNDAVIWYRNTGE